MGNWKILVPRTTTIKNLFGDPSGERGVNNSNGTIIGMLTVDNRPSKDTYIYRGGVAWRFYIQGGSFQYPYYGGSVQDGLPYLVGGTLYTYSFYARFDEILSGFFLVACRQANDLFTGPLVLNSDVTLQVVANQWVRFSASFTPTTTDRYKVGWKALTDGSNVFVSTDAWMLSEGTLMEYFDGDTPGAYWEGIPHASSSVSEPTNENVGTWVDLEDTYGIIVKGADDAGVATLDNQVIEIAQAERSDFLRTIASVRDMSLQLWINGDSYSEAAQLRRPLIAGLHIGTPFWLKYVGFSQDVKIKVVVKAGLELRKASGFVDQPLLSLTAYDPYWYSDEEHIGKTVDFYRKQACAYIIRRKPNGVWERLGAPSGVVNVVYYSPFDGRVYIGGNFVTDTITSDNIARAAYWDENLAKWVRVANVDIATEVYDIKVGIDDVIYLATAAGVQGRLKDGTLHAVGASTSPTYALAIDIYGDVKWIITTGWTGTIRDFTIDQNNTYYIVGDFTLVPVASVLRAAYSNNLGGSWTQMGSGVNAIVRSIFITTSGEIYIGGEFTLSGATTINRFGRYNGSVIQPQSTGVSDSALTAGIYTINQIRNGNIILGGIIDTAAGVLLPAFDDVTDDYKARLVEWTGSVFIPSDVIPPTGNNAITSIAVTRDGAVYVAFNGTGNAIVPNTTLITNPGLSTGKPTILSDGYNVSIHRIDNYTTGVTVGLKKAPAFATLFDTNKLSNQVRLVLQPNGDVFLAQGASLSVIDIPPGDNYIGVFGTTVTIGAPPDWVPGSQVSFVERHIAIEGGAK